MAGTVGTDAAGSDGTGTECTAAPPEVYTASKPLASTEPSAENTTYMLPDVAVTGAGTLLPLNDPSRAPLLLEPSYTLRVSYCASVSNDEKRSVMGEPMEIVN